MSVLNPFNLPPPTTPAGARVVHSNSELEQLPRVPGMYAFATFLTPPALLRCDESGTWVFAAASAPLSPSNPAQPQVELTRQDVYELILGGYLERIDYDQHRKFFDLCIRVPAAFIYTEGSMHRAFPFQVSTNEGASNGKFNSSVWVSPSSLPHQRNQIERCCLFLRPHITEAVVANPQMLQDPKATYSFYFKMRDGHTEIGHF